MKRKVTSRLKTFVSRVNDALLKKDYPEALRVVDLIIKRGYSDLHFRILRAVVLYLKGAHEKAIRECSDLGESFLFARTQPRANILLPATVHMGQELVTAFDELVTATRIKRIGSEQHEGNLGKAIAVAKLFRKSSPLWMSAIEYIAGAQLELHHNKAAIREASKGLKNDPSNANLLMTRGVAFSTRLRFDLAAKDLAEYCHLRPDDPEGQELLEAYTRIANYKKKEKEGDSEANYSSQDELDTESSAPQSGTAETQADREELKAVIHDLNVILARKNTNELHDDFAPNLKYTKAMFERFREIYTKLRNQVEAYDELCKLYPHNLEPNKSASFLVQFRRYISSFNKRKDQK